MCAKYPNYCRVIQYNKSIVNRCVPFDFVLLLLSIVDKRWFIRVAKEANSKNECKRGLGVNGQQKKKDKKHTRARENKKKSSGSAEKVRISSGVQFFFVIGGKVFVSFFLFIYLLCSE